MKTLRNICILMVFAIGPVTANDVEFRPINLIGLLQPPTADLRPLTPHEKTFIMRYMHEVGTTIGYVNGQQMSLDVIGRRYPDLHTRAVAASQIFMRAWGPGVGNCRRLLSSMIPIARDSGVNEAHIKQMRDTLDGTTLISTLEHQNKTMTHADAEDFIKTVEDRARGHFEQAAINMSVPETLTRFMPTLSTNPLSGFIPPYRFLQSIQTANLRIILPHAMRSVESNADVLGKWRMDMPNAYKFTFSVSSYQLTEELAQEVKGGVNQPWIKQMIAETQKVNFSDITWETIRLPNFNNSICLIGRYRSSHLQSINGQDVQYVLAGRMAIYMHNEKLIKIQSFVSDTTAFDAEIKLDDPLDRRHRDFLFTALRHIHPMP